LIGQTKPAEATCTNGRTSLSHDTRDPAVSTAQSITASGVEMSLPLEVVFVAVLSFVRMADEEAAPETPPPRSAV